MSQKYQTRPDQGRVGCDKLAGGSHHFLSLSSYRAQHLIALWVRPELAALVASLVFDGGAFHG